MNTDTKSPVSPEIEAAPAWPALAPERFPLLRAATPRPRRFDEAVEAVAEAVAAGTIRNVILASVKSTLGVAVSDGWQKHVSEPYFFAGKIDTHAVDVQDLFHRFLPSSTHDVLAMHRALEKTKATGPAVDAMRAFANEVHPLAAAVASLKDKVVKGRAPASGVATKPVNPNKVVRTCPVCFRGIAVVRGLMAHHGYQRPELGWQTASCGGISFQPLERSSEGLMWLIGALRNRLATVEKALAASDEMTSLPTRVRGAWTTVTPDAPAWTAAFKRHVLSLESEIGALGREIPRLEGTLKEWVQTEAACER